MTAQKPNCNVAIKPISMVDSFQNLYFFTPLYVKQYHTIPKSLMVVTLKEDVFPMVYTFTDLEKYLGLYTYCHT